MSVTFTYFQWAFHENSYLHCVLNVHHWHQHLLRPGMFGFGSFRYAVVDESDPYNDPFDTNMLDTNSVEGDALGDAMLRQWVIQNLTP